MKSTRENILYTLLVNSESTISELAEIVGINGISVRHHLINLQNEGLIESEEERHGVGRPRFVYRLTEKGLEKFPTNYLRLTNQIISAMKVTISRDIVANMFRQIGEDLAKEIHLDTDHFSTPEQIKALSARMVNQGYRLTCEHDGENYRLINHNCPYHQVSAEHPEVCLIDESMFSAILKREIWHSQCISRGDHYCSFIIRG